MACPTPKGDTAVSHDSTLQVHEPSRCLVPTTIQPLTPLEARACEALFSRLPAPVVSMECIVWLIHSCGLHRSLADVEVSFKGLGVEIGPTRPLDLVTFLNFMALQKAWYIDIVSHNQNAEILNAFASFGGNPDGTGSISKADLLAHAAELGLIFKPKGYVSAKHQLQLADFQQLLGRAVRSKENFDSLQWLADLQQLLQCEEEETLMTTKPLLAIDPASRSSENLTNRLMAAGADLLRTTSIEANHFPKRQGSIWPSATSFLADSRRNTVFPRTPTSCLPTFCRSTTARKASFSPTGTPKMCRHTALNAKNEAAPEPLSPEDNRSSKLRFEFSAAHIHQMQQRIASIGKSQIDLPPELLKSESYCRRHRRSQEQGCQQPLPAPTGPISKDIRGGAEKQRASKLKDRLPRPQAEQDINVLLKELRWAQPTLHSRKPQKKGTRLSKKDRYHLWVFVEDAVLPQEHIINAHSVDEVVGELQRCLLTRDAEGQVHQGVVPIAQVLHSLPNRHGGWHWAPLTDLHELRKRPTLLVFLATFEPPHTEAQLRITQEDDEPPVPCQPPISHSELPAAGKTLLLDANDS